jgi:hypothetical protein
VDHSHWLQRHTISHQIIRVNTNDPPTSFTFSHTQTVSQCESKQIALSHHVVAGSKVVAREITRHLGGGLYNMCQTDTCFHNTLDLDLQSVVTHFGTFDHSTHNSSFCYACHQTLVELHNTITHGAHTTKSTGKHAMSKIAGE